MLKRKISISIIILRATLGFIDAQAKLVFVGNANEVTEFCLLLQKGEIISNTLKTLVQEVEADKKTILLHVVRDNDVFIAAHERIYLYDFKIKISNGDEILEDAQCHAFTFDLYDLNEFPVAIKDPISNEITISNGAPKWAITQYSIIAHELAEALDGFRNGWSPKNHERGIEKENEVRKELKQDEQRGADWEDNGPPARIIEVGKNKVILVRDKDNKGRLLEIKYQ